VFFLFGFLAVLTAAVGIGLGVRTMRLGEKIEVERRQALLKLRGGNVADFMSAAQIYSDILARHSSDRHAHWAQAQVRAAILFEFGDASFEVKKLPESISEKDKEDINWLAMEIYRSLNSGSLERARVVLAQAQRLHPDSPLLYYLAGQISLLQGKGALPKATWNRPSNSTRKIL